MDTFLQDLRYAVRGLLRDRAFTLVAVLTLAVGIGANTVIFSYLDRLTLRPFDFPELERLVYITEQQPGYERLRLSLATVSDLREEASLLEGVGAYRWWDTNLTGTVEPERVIGYQVSPELFTALRTPAALGRALLPDEAKEGSHQVVVLSHGLWERRFGKDAGVVGRSVTLDGAPYTVVGVMPPDFRFPKAAELWVPLVLPADASARRREHSYQVVGRLKDGATLESLRAQLARLHERMAAEEPGHRIFAEPLRDYGDPKVRLMMWTMLGATALVLLVACANVAGMMLARAARRARELAIRGALGASRWRMARQLLTECLVLSLPGAVAGLLLALWGIDLMRSGLPADMSRHVSGWEHVGLDARVLGFTLAVSVGAVLFFGLVPALRAAKVQPADVLRREGRGLAGGRQRLRTALVAAQLAFALVLTVCAALNARSFAAMMNTPAGFEREGLLTLQLGVSTSKYRDEDAVRRYYEEALARLRALPGVGAVAAASDLPLGPSWSTRTLELDGREPLPEGQELRVLYQIVTEDYFRTMGIPLRDGALFTEADGPEAPKVVLISESLARRHFPDGSAVGRRIALGRVDGQPVWRTVAGVVADVQVSDFFFNGGRRESVYVPHRQVVERDMFLAVRTAGDPMSVAPAVRRELLALDSEQPVAAMKAMERVVHETLLAPRYGMVLLLVFASIALGLSAVGVYGVMAYSVSQRTRELGIRMALGATRAEVMRLVVWQGLRPTLTGVAVGLVGAVAAAHAMASLLYGVSPFDPVLFLAMAAFLVTVALLASLIPVRHATRVDPAIALRAE
ncbi:ABC transporter permease [Pyxidicoccus fallax]|uniref:ABC transporter permease n=1 Tax=Pyxidicoccus fallax TaxID=394095 RepID=A0A848LMZ9_9BACT|nr:ABC transporter permease [Pyxidicoccus fallax]NMO19032.1 ABC transporter permease [Pyxidicoccus fallax]NPC84563.1 ABC transporter permease [Pyxidicoccus fallax]